ncbi:hypothetical protein CC78DRAFT_581549 [Lojkania enalia]|uniref:Uncharacterized protein n=1 Tax=Lojkania enalia TaxID=147567 RepID=A0A9P4N2J3_9PLEO|nr:hypothetical protein CC78DRAFT_581549 [Didymosphaeria enalia]
MPPKRDIRDFFKPTLNSQPPRPSTTTQRTVTSAPGEWAGKDDTSAPTLALSTASAKAPPNTSAVDHIDRTTTTAPPTTSQSSTNSAGSKRTIIDGEPVVQNSDSDTDSDILVELDFGIRKSPPQQPVGSRERRRPQEAYTTRSAGLVYIRDDGLRKPTDNQKSSKLSLSRLVQVAQRRAEAEQKIAEEKANLEKLVEEPSTLEVAINEKVLAGIVDANDDGDNAKRLYLAMQRTNALDIKCAFHMFGEESNQSSIHTSAFPVQSLPKHSWVSCLEDSWNRNQAFLSGFAQQVFQFQALPEELAIWLVDQISVGQSEGLNIKYIQLLETHPHHLQAILTPNKMNNLLHNIGVEMQCISMLHEVIPSFEAHDTPKRPLPASLSLSTKSSIHALYLLFLLCFDDSVMSDADTLHDVQDAIESIMCSISVAELTPVLNDLVPILLARITHPVLQSGLIRSLPVRSPLMASFQRYLALSFFLHPSPLNVPLHSPKLPSLIHSHLETSPAFIINKDTDYTAFTACLTLLDIGIGPGLANVPYRPLFSPSASQEDLGIGQLLKPLSSEEIAFNKQVDALAQHIKLLSNNIVEAGAIGDLTRLDAKDGSERLYHRLENAVRIGGRRLNNIFANEKDEEGSMQRVLGRWLGPKFGTQASNVNGGISNGEVREG